MLASACDRHCGEIDIEIELTTVGNTEENNSQKAPVFRKSLFNQDRTIKNDGLEPQDINEKFGNDLQEPLRQ